MSVNGWSHRYNFDGVVTFGGNCGEPTRSYVQVFRSGALEATMAIRDRASDGNLYLNPWGIEEAILEVLDGDRGYLARYKQNGFEPPFVIALSVLGVKGGMLCPPRQHHIENLYEIEHDSLLLPDVLIQDYEAPIHTVMRPAFDSLWQAFGVSKSLCYDENGDWFGKSFRW
jgi:hypothetical protein